MEMTMNHKFKSNASAPATCIECNHDVVTHSEFATCDICKRFPVIVDIYKGYEEYVMCAGCYASENEAALVNKAKLNEASKVIPETIQRIETEFASRNGNDIKDSAIVDLPMNGDEYFNAETIATVELEKRVLSNSDVPEDKKNFDFHQQMQMRQAHLQVALKKGIELLVETRSRLSSIQRSMNVNAAKLRKDERDKLKIADINYVPKEIPKKVQARTTEKNKVVINIAQIFCAPRDAKGNFIWNELTDEQREECLVRARKIFASNMSSINAAVSVVEAASKENK